MNKIDVIERDFLKKSLPEFNVGDEVKVHLKVQEGEKSRIQIFAGTVVKKRGRGINAGFSVLKEIREDIVEKSFLIHSPQVEKITVTTKGKARRAKLYHLRKEHPGNK